MVLGHIEMYYKFSASFEKKKKIVKIMAFNSLSNLKRLEEQIFYYKPTLKTKEQKENVSKRLRDQLLESKAVVRIQRMDAECESLMISLKQRLMLLQDILVPQEKEIQLTQKQKDTNEQDPEDIMKLNLSSDSSDEETLSSLMSKRKEPEKRKSKMVKKVKGGKQTNIETQQADTSETTNSYLPLALRKKPRERKMSYKSLSSSASTSHSKQNGSRLQNKQEHRVTTSGMAFHSEEMLVEQEEIEATPTLHIKIPSLHRGNVHYIILDSLNFARKVFDYRANEVKQQQLQKQSSITHSTKISKTRKKQVKSLSASTDPVLQEFTQQEQELELSQLIQDVMAEACNDETLQATSALENINNNLIDNYESVDQDNFITYSQSSQEISYSQNSNIIETICSTNTLQKKPRKNNKRTTEQQSNEPPRKRGRKAKKKNNTVDLELQPQPPTKSNLAKYVEFFANDCELLPGSTTPAASSTRSQPLVSSTTQNFEVADQLPQNQEQQTSPQQQQPITYYIDGDWVNGGPCQLVPTNCMSVDTRQLNQDDMNAPFQDFVNYIDNNGDTGNNVIARVLEANHSLPISIPLPIANIGLQTKTIHQTPRPRQIQQTIQNPVPIINIQIPSLPNNITSHSAPPPAHTHKEVLDLSFKSKTNFNIINNEVVNLNKKSNNNIKTSNCFIAEVDDCLPLDLSVKGCGATRNTSVTIDNQDEEFIRRLIEQSNFEYTNDELKSIGHSSTIVSAYDHENEKSFKAALDMPLLDFDASDLTDLVENGEGETNKQQNNKTDKINYVNSTNNSDSNYVSMTGVNSDLNFPDQSTSEIFNKLLDICPENQIFDNINNEFNSNDNLNESVFDQCRVENSTMCDVQNSTNGKNLSDKQEKEFCDTTSQQIDKPDKENISNNETSSSSSTSTSLAVQIDSSNNISISSDISLNLKLSFNEEPKDKLLNLNQNEVTNMSNNGHINSESSSILDKHKAITNNANTEALLASETQINNLETDHHIKSNKTDNTLSDFPKNNLEKPKPFEIYIENRESTNMTHTNNNEQSQNHFKVNDANKKSEQYVDNKCFCVSSNKDNLTKDEPKVIDLMNTNKKFSSPKCKTKENVVFSVAKITLSEDEHLFTIDSDASSGKSIDVRDIKPNHTDVDKKEKPYKCQKTNSENTSDIEHKDPNENDNTGQDITDKEGDSSSKVINLKIPAIDNENSSELMDQNVTEILLKESENSCSEVINLKLTKIDNKRPCQIMEQDDSELKPKETDSCCSEVLNLSISSKNHNDNESGTEDIIIYDVEDTDFCTEESQDMVQTKECKIETDKNLENITVKKPNDEDKKQINIDMNITKQNLTLLELESKLESSLDFEEDYDDTLSLATSCFDSPNDERFEDSVVNEDTTTTAITDKPPENQHTIPNDKQPNKDLKHFKIPKITLSTTKEMQPKINLEKITRTVKNDFIKTNNNSVDSPNIPLQDETPALVKVMQEVFGISCLPYLVDKCYAITHCQLSHEFNDTETVYQNLNTLDEININLAYQVLYNHSKLFKLYFSAFCTYYTTKNDRVKLLNMVNDCERYPEYAEFIIVIYESMVNCGLSRVNACRLILKRIREITTASTIIEALVAIIMKSDWTMFTDFIEKYTQEAYKYNYRIGILEQMAPAVLNSKGSHLKEVFGKCVQTLHRADTGLLLNSPILIQCVAFLTTST